MPSRIARAGFEMFLRRDISSIGRTRRAIAAFAAVLVVLASVTSADSATCPDEQQTGQVPGNLALCDELELPSFVKTSGSTRVVRRARAGCAATKLAFP